ncbi:putative ABC transporter permease [Clostridium sp. BJN0001]|uniref:putative ABC transporter permease n=1 Tax=Clostridium sp. BJN0001 TaxID=2930219 RepID=UPI001FD4B3CB|nr:putative ABC transporter permease [Clostridium sp. BJN0001]
MLNNLICYNIIFYFMIYSFLGWCTEVLYYFKIEHKFVNRGFLYGPFCPIYGCGIILVITLLDEYKNNLFILFISAFFLTSILEYITGYILEKLFKSKWWDYTDDPFNINGRVCLLYSILWAISCVFIIKVLHPLNILISNNISLNIKLFVSYVFSIYFFTDSIFTVLSLIKFKSLLTKLQLQLVSVRESEIFTRGNVILNAKEKALKTVQSLSKMKFNLNHIRLIKAFPNVSSKKFGYILNSIKDYIKKEK